MENPTVQAIPLLEFNKQQQGRAERLADALDLFVQASAEYRAEIRADENLPQGAARDLAAMQRTYSARLMAAVAVQCRIQEIAGINLAVVAL